MLSSYLDTNKIIVDLNAKTFHDAVQQLIKRSCEQNHEILLVKLLDRERLMSTALGKGVAFPRVLIPDKTLSEIIIGISKNGIDSRGFDLVPITMIVLHIFSPQDDHAAILAESLHVFNDNTMRTELLQARNGEEFVQRVREWEEK